MSTGEVTTTEENKMETPADIEKGLAEARRISEFRLKTLSQLIGVYIDTFSAEMVSTNGKSYADKLIAAKALKEGILFALDFGLGVTKANIRDGGRLSKEVNGLAGTLVQALDTRFILLADNMKKLQEQDDAAAQNQTETNTVTEENKEANNG
jgi:hypothetical protein